MRKTASADDITDPDHELGVFGSEAAQDVLDKATQLVAWLLSQITLGMCHLATQKMDPLGGWNLSLPGRMTHLLLSDDVVCVRSTRHQQNC